MFEYNYDLVLNLASNLYNENEYSGLINIPVINTSKIYNKYIHWHSSRKSLVVVQSSSYNRCRTDSLQECDILWIRMLSRTTSTS